jgi:hypothetical protein
MSIRTYTEQDIVDAFAQTGLAPVRRTWAHHLRGDERIPCGCALVALAQAAGLDTATINHNATDYASALDSSIGHICGILNGWDHDDVETEPSAEDCPDEPPTFIPDYFLGWRAAAAASNTLAPKGWNRRAWSDPAQSPIEKGTTP